MTTPAWLDTKEYPFEPHFFKTSAGNMHYVDEGQVNRSSLSTAILHGRFCSGT